MKSRCISALRRGLLVSLALVLASPLSGVATADPFRPGAAGAGDPYYPRAGNGGYDVRHYRLALRYTPAKDRFSGAARIEARARQNLSRFNLDLDRLTVRSVTVNGRRAAWERRRGELIIDPAGRGLRKGKEFTTTIRYSGVPRTLQDAFGESGVFHTDDGVLIAGQPRVASTWFPVNDHPTDKASFSFAITVPKGREVVANGILTGTRTQKGWTTWSWTAKAPMAAYLATVNVGDFDIDSYRRDGIRYWDAIDPDLFDTVARPRPGGRSAVPGPGSPSLGDVARASLARQPEIIRALARMAGPYPFATSGGIVDDEERLQFALETQTRPVYGPSWWHDPRDGDLVVVHELAHQWYGNSVTLRRWRDIWLNEGFATYAEWLWLEHEGVKTARQTLRETYNDIPASSKFWRLDMVDPGPDALFDAPIYVRGAMVLQALRMRVGDDDFFRITRRWAQARAGDNVSTAQLIRLAERISGASLDRLFDRWLIQQRKPRWAGANPNANAQSPLSRALPHGHPHRGR